MTFLRRADEARREDVARDLAASRRNEAVRLGETFRNERVRRAVSIAEAERTTRINRVYLEAIEEGRLEALPAPVYTRGFVRLYARFLGLDPDAAVAAIPDGLPRPAGLEPMPGMRRSAPPTIPIPPLTPPVIVASVLGLALLLTLVWLVPRAFGDEPVTAAGGGGAPVASTPAVRTGEVPNLVGMSREQATKSLTDAGLAPLVFEATNAAPPGQVFQQSPAPGSTIAPGGTVTLFISQPPLSTSPTPTRTPTATPAR